VPREAAAERELDVQGITVPKLGLGTWQITGRDCVDAVRDALELGYRHIDTARLYENEAEVGAGIAAAEVDREEVFVTTKLSQEGLREDQVRRQCEASLRALGSEYVDLLLIHWPNDAVPLGETLGQMQRLRDEGKARNLGVSNFPRDLLAEALELAPVIANQVEYHPYLAQPALLELCRERDVTLTAYSPFAHGKALRDPVLREIGDAHGKSAPQVTLRWLLDQPQVSTVPKAASHAKRAANLDVFDFELDDEERGRIAALAGDDRQIDPPWAPDWDEGR
jgi:2,5-diketo-D-gluconate reductase B